MEGPLPELRHLRQPHSVEPLVSLNFMVNASLPVQFLGSAARFAADRFVSFLLEIIFPPFLSTVAPSLLPIAFLRTQFLIVDALGDYCSSCVHDSPSTG